MDRIEHYRTIVTRLIEEYTAYMSKDGPIETEAIIDRERDHYQIMQVGWNGQYRVHYCEIHIDIRDGLVWLQHDGTKWVIADEPVAAGIPREDIVLGFQPEYIRPYTPYSTKGRPAGQDAPVWVP